MSVSEKSTKLKDILAISGYPGLYIYVAQGTNGLIVESLIDGKRANMPATSRVSSMGEIAIYTDQDEMPLSEVFTSLFAKTEGKQTISHKSNTDEIKGLIEEIAPNYDHDRVHVSDMKKIIQWYNNLIEIGITDFSVEEEDEDEQPKIEQKGQQKGLPKMARTEQKGQKGGQQMVKKSDQQKKVKK